MRSVALFLIALVGCSARAPASGVAPGPPAPARAAAATSSCAPPDGREPPIAFNGAPLVVLCHGLYADPATTAEEREALTGWYGESSRALTTVFGAAKREPLTAITCNTDACALHFSGPTRRSRALMKPRPTVVINGVGELTKGTMIHEMIHVEIARRMGRTEPGGIPTWFDEGMATFVGDNISCPAGTARAVDDLRRLDAPYAWDHFTNITGKIRPAYCQARGEIAAWTKRRGVPALVDVIDAVAAGRPFDEVYGPLLTIIPPEAFGRSLDGRFPLDENHGTDAVDTTGRSHIASLMGGAIWTTGHSGAGVKVMGGSYVRADGFVDFALPDAPFSISLWAKPLANAKVLVHASMNASGGDGWCGPIVGHDAGGHLVAQVNFTNDAHAFLTAKGPVLPLSTWSHVVTTWSPTDGLRLYVNGKLAAAAQPRSAAEHHRLAPAAPAYLFFGSDNEANCWTDTIEPGSWNGALDELRVYDHALTAEQVASDMGGK